MVGGSGGEPGSSSRGSTGSIGSVLIRFIRFMFRFLLEEKDKPINDEEVGKSQPTLEVVISPSEVRLMYDVSNQIHPCLKEYWDRHAIISQDPAFEENHYLKDDEKPIGQIQKVRVEGMVLGVNVLNKHIRKDGQNRPRQKPSIPHPVTPPEHDQTQNYIPRNRHHEYNGHE